MSIAEEPLGLGYIIMLSTKKFVLSPVLYLVKMKVYYKFFSHI